MVRLIILILLSSLLYLCSCSKHTIADGERTSTDMLYQVKRIKKVNDWYFIYLQRNDSIFKVITHEPSDKETFEDHQKIRKRGRYNLHIMSYKDSLMWNGINIWPIGYTGGVYLDSITTVSVEPENGIWDLYSTYDLEGLYYIK